MAGIESKRFDAPDERRTPPKTEMDIVSIAGTEIARIAFHPGWKWSECIKPVVGTDSCQVEHVGFFESGHMHVVHDDGTEMDLRPGQVYRIAPGHDAWNVGDETIVAYEFKSAATFAKGS